MSKKRIPAPETSSAETIVELVRLNALCDGVFAIALTLLVLDIRLPEDVLAGELLNTLVNLAPKILIYLISFIVIGGAWGSHQRMLSQIKRGDGLLVWFTLLLLLFVTLLPACAALLGRFPGELVAIVCFAADVILIQLSALWLWRHASRNGLVNASLDPRVVAGVGYRLILSAGAFGLSVGLVILSPSAVYVAWIGLFIFIFATDWLSWQQSLKATPAVILLDGAAQGQIDIVHGAGLLKLVADAPDKVLVEGMFGGGMDWQSTRDGKVLKTRLDAASRKQGLMSLRYPWAWGRANTLDWIMSLNPHVPVGMHITTGAGQVELDFARAHLTDLWIQAYASSMIIRLPAEAGLTTVRIEASGSDIEFRVPAAVAARIRATKAMASLEVDLERFALVEDGKEYCSSDYDTAANRVDIQLELAVGSAKVSSE